jgi:hypothetical protein
MAEVGCWDMMREKSAGITLGRASMDVWREFELESGRVDIPIGT